MFYKTSPILLLLSITIAISEQHSCPNATAKEKHENAFELIAKENSKYEKFKDDRLFEIDMKRPKVLRTDGDSGGPGEAARRNKYFFWKDGIIPYTFGPTLRQQKDYIKKVEDAMKEFHENTCLRFKKRDREADYVEIVYGNGCMSDVGKIGGKQQTSLGSGCYRHGIIVHELGHVAGFQHEQNRPDREQYVKVLYDNIQNKFKYAFNMFDDRAIDSRGVPYDYQSVMHYGGYDFSKNGKPTIKSLNHRVTFFGNNQLSPLDIKQLNLMYQCGGKIPDFPGDFKWRTNGRSDDEICTLITDDREPSSTGWDDNFLCQRKDNRDLKIRWSQNGALRNMRCTKVTFPNKNNKKNSWSNSYLCVPTNGFYNFTWSTNGPVKGLQCLAITEPQDPYMKGKNFHLCAKSRKTDGQWSNWAPWPQCSKPCGGGLHTRTRSCDNPRPAFGGKYCRGESSETRRCNRHVCSTWPSFPADFEYRTYNSMPYDKTCVRTYERLDYLYWNNYFLCVTSGKRNLNMRWSDSGHQPNMKCVTIEEPGESWRWNDNCLCLPKDSPYEFKWSYNGKIPGLPCLKWEARGGAQGWDNNYLCASKLPNSSGSVGRWSAWSAWGTCSKTCGIGIQERRRTCSNAPCSGSSNETKVCNKKKCAGRWSKWSGWGSCSKTCGTGIQKRRRTCFKPPCTGLGNEVKLCKRKDCERWSRWSAWSRCSKTCGSGYQRRDRTCSGAPCTGSKRQTRVCNRKACVRPVGRWSKWSAWSRCSKTCGTGNQRRDRTCSRAPCTGSRTEARVCKMKDCERWSRWSAWSGCSKTCGTGYQRRDRTCSGAPCTGSKRQTRVCNRKACERWSRWSAWNKCSKTCGTGYQRRYRTCSGAPCTASKRQTRFCKMRNCKRTCGGTLTADSGVLSSIANPKNMICVWFIEVSRAKFIDLTFVNLDLSTSRRCRNNYVELRKYTSYNSVRGISFGRKCGKTNGNIFHARTNKMRIKLKATNNRGKGFKISWTTKVANMNAKAFKG